MGRRVVVWLCYATALLSATSQIARGPVGYGYGWGAAVMSAVLVAAPLVVLGLAVAAGRPDYAWVTLALAAGIEVFVLLALVGNWAGQSPTDNTVDAVLSALATAACVGASVLELPLVPRRPR